MAADDSPALSLPVFYPHDLGHALRSVREESGMTQAAFAAEVGVSRKWLSEAEGGKPGIEVGLVLAALREAGYMIAVTKMPEPDFDIEAHLRALMET